MSDERCDWCLRPAAPEEWESATTGEQRDGYCWGPGDALCDELHEAEWERMRAEVARLREQVAEEHAAWQGVTEQWKYAQGRIDELGQRLATAQKEIVTLRAALGQYAPVAVLSPLDAYPVAAGVGEPYPVCQGCNRLVVECSCASKAETRHPPLICPDCGCVWPLLAPGTETTVTCNCGKVLGCQSRREP